MLGKDEEKIDYDNDRRHLHVDGEVGEEGEGRGSKEEESQLDECKIVLRTEHSVLYTVHCEIAK